MLFLGRRSTTQAARHEAELLIANFGLRAQEAAMRWILPGVFAALSSLTSPNPSLAQAVAGGTCRPVAQRTQDVGCWVLANQAIGQLTKSETYWHLDAYPNRAAAEAAKGPGGAVVEALGKIWLLTIEDRGWRAPSGGERIAEIGPLPITAGMYAVQYMEAVFTPGMTSVTHTHSGPEAWYTATGEMCLETPDGKLVGRAGGPPVIIPAGPPMQLMAIGTETRRGIVLILHDASKPSTTIERDWKPKGLCKE